MKECPACKIDATPSTFIGVGMKPCGRVNDMLVFRGFDNPLGCPMSVWQDGFIDCLKMVTPKITELQTELREAMVPWWKKLFGNKP